MSRVSGLVFAGPELLFEPHLSFLCTVFNVQLSPTGWCGSRSDHDGLKANVQNETGASPTRLLPSLYSQPLLAIPAIEFEGDDMHMMLNFCELETICGNG